MVAANPHRITVQKRNLISIPKEIRKQFQIKEGDILDIRVDGNKIVIEPYKLVPASQAYFWTEATQADIKEAHEDAKSGMVREFNNMDEFIKGLGHD